MKRNARNGGLWKNSNEPSKSWPRFPQQTGFQNLDKPLRIWPRCPQSVAAIPAPVESRTSLALQLMLQAHQPSAWCLGHFHINREIRDRRNEIPLLGGDGRIRDRVVRFSLGVGRVAMANLYQTIQRIHWGMTARSSGDRC